MFKKILIFLFFPIIFYAMEMPPTGFVIFKESKKSLKNRIARLTKAAHSGNITVLRELAEALLEDNNPQEALFWAKKQKLVAPELLARIYLELDDIENAETYARKANSLESQAILAQVLEIKGEIEMAETYYLAAALASEERLLELADFYRRHKNMEKAKEFYTKLSRELIGNESLVDILYQAKGGLAELNKNWQEAADWYKKADDRDALARVYQEMGDEERAQKLFAQIAREEDCGYAYYQLGLSAIKRKDFPEAIKQLEKSVTKIGCILDDPEYPGDAYYHLYKLYQRTDPKKADEMLQKAVSHKNVRALDKLGIISSEKKENEKAKEYFLAAASKGDLRAKYNLGVMAEISGAYGEAKKYYAELSKENYKDATKRLKIVINKQLKKYKEEQEKKQQNP